MHIIGYYNTYLDIRIKLFFEYERSELVGDGTNKRTTFKIFGNLLSEFCGTEQSYAFNVGWKLGERQLVITALASFAPISKEYIPSSTQRTNLFTKLHRNSTKMGNKHTRQDHRASRKEERKNRLNMIWKHTELHC